MLYETKNVILKDGQVAVLRNVNEEDAFDIIEHMKNISSETNYVLRYKEEVAMTIDEERNFLKFKSQSDSSLMIVCMINNKVIASCDIEFNDFIKTKHRAEVSIAIEKDYWNNGLGTLMFNELIHIAQVHNIKQVELEVIEGNNRAIHLYEKLGFEITGYKPNAICLKDGTSLKLYQMVKYLKVK